MLATLGLVLKTIMRAGVKGAVLVPRLLYQKSKAARVFEAQLRQQEIPESTIRELTKCYRSLVSFQHNNSSCK
jgi:hypothetical protein